MQSRTYPARLASIFLLSLLLIFAVPGISAQALPVQATTVPLILPGGLAYDAAGNLFFAETANHVVRRVSLTGVLTTVAGTGVQGFGGDGGVATAAQLDSPLAIAFDLSGNLYIADSHNHRIRRVDQVSGVIASLVAVVDLPSALAFDSLGDLFYSDQRTHVIRRIDAASGAVRTVAGDGIQGYSGDGGLATVAAIDSPAGIALDAAGNLYLSDTHNHRIRRVDSVSGVITSVVGTGQPGFTGDGGDAVGAQISLPRGLLMDGAGNLFLVDSRNERVRRVDAVTGQVTSIAGVGTQAFAGDSNPAVDASLDTPRAVTLAPGNLPTIADAGNGRVRQVDSAGMIHTIAGLGTTVPGALTLAGPSVALYGTGTLTATLVASPASGFVTFFDQGSGSALSLGTFLLTNNAASLSTAALNAGLHRISATYAGDTLHVAALSSVLSLTISPAPVVASLKPVTMLYGQNPPALTGSMSGVLAQDSGLVTLGLSSSASSTSDTGAYPIFASLYGTAAGNYVISQPSVEVTVLPAASTITLSSALAAHVATTTSGIPLGTVTLYDAGTFSSTATLSGTGDAVFSSSGLSNGSHTLAAVYGGDPDFLGSTSNSTIITVGPVVAADFSLAATGSTTVIVAGGGAAQFSFAVNPLNGALSSPILLTASGLPVGATASFNPAYLVPGNTPSAFVLTIQTAKTAGLMRTAGLIVAMLLPVGFLARRRRRRTLLVTGLLTVSLGCGDRINSEAIKAANVSYNVTVIGTATSAAGTTVQHTAGVTLTVQ